MCRCGSGYEGTTCGTGTSQVRVTYIKCHSLFFYFRLWCAGMRTISCNCCIVLSTVVSSRCGDTGVGSDLRSFSCFCSPCSLTSISHGWCHMHSVAEESAATTSVSERFLTVICVIGCNAIKRVRDHIKFTLKV